MLIKYFNESNTRFKLIIAPHEIHKENINRIIKSVSKEKVVMKYSEANKENVSNADVLIIDSIGLLSSIYKYGHIAYIGGGFGKGIHNILEAATFGLPIIFGTNYKKFREAVDLIKSGGAFSIVNYNELENSLISLLKDPDKLRECGKISSNYVEKNRGATDTILRMVKIDI